MRRLKQAGLCVLALCTLLLWYSAEAAQKQAAWFDGSVSVRWEEGAGVSPRQIDRVLDWQREDGGTPPPLALWKTHENQHLYGDLHPAPAAGEVLEYYGEITRLLPCRFRSGFWPGDRQGCVIDEGIAYFLWGDAEDVLGRTLRWNEETWYVRGVMEETSGLAVFPAEETNETPFSGLWLDLSADSSGSLGAEQLLQKYQLPVGTATDLGLFVWLSGVMAALPAVLLWGWIMLRIAVRLWRLRYTRMLLFLTLPMLAAGAAAVSWAAGFPWTVPERFLPTRWSDGSFWSELASSVLDGVLTMFRTPPAPWEVVFWTGFFRCAALAVPAGIFLWLTARTLPRPTSKSIFWYSLIWWAGLLGTVWWNRGTLYGGPSISVWVLPPVWMVSNWILDRSAQWLMPKTNSDEREMLYDPVETDQETL